MRNPSVIYELNIDLGSENWGVSCPTDQSLIGPVQYGWDRYKKDPQSMTFGGGLLAGSPLSGTRRMIFCGYSPQWEGFYISALGGAMYVMHRVGVNYVWLRGKAKHPIIILISYINGQYTVKFVPIQVKKYWEGYSVHDQEKWFGFHGINHYLFETYRTFFQNCEWRILTVGPAAKYTNSGAIGSTQIRNGALSVIEDWAGRGGLGSRLLQHHGVAGIVFGGDWQDPALKEARELDQYFIDHFGQNAIKSDLAMSEKYRYVPKFNTGGTFGVNMYEGEDRIYSFNYSSIYHTYEERLAQHDSFITTHYLQQFNDEIITPRKFTHCGEPCAVACKKYFDRYKKDYEPYQALGPNIGVFDQRAAEKINGAVDQSGMDSIQAGGTISWLMELFHKQLLQPAEFGLKPQLPKFNFVSTPEEFDLVNDSATNADIAINILNMILYSPFGKPFRKGIRYAAKWIDRKYKIHSIDLAVYNANGKYGCMVPNQYWTPGMFSPMPIMGKYFSYYGNDFMPPYQLGKKNVERFVYELYSENSGSCRFHRKWVEDIIDEIILSHFELDFDYWKTNFQVVKEISEYQSDKAVFWESSRVVDIIHQFLQRWKERDLENTDLDRWIGLFDKNTHNAARKFWKEMYKGMLDAISSDLPEPAHNNHSK